MMECVKRAAAANGGGRITTGGYHAWREERWRHGEALPSFRTICARLGGWREVLVLAGLAPASIKDGYGRGQGRKVAVEYMADVSDCRSPRAWHAVVDYPQALGAGP